MIHKVGERYVISSGGTWLNGCYATKEAARYAFQFHDDILFEMNRKINIGEDRDITTEDLRKYARKNSEKKN